MMIWEMAVIFLKFGLFNIYTAKRVSTIYDY